ncbi:MAG: hypothetical protein H0T46_26115, partial [Deltaproteobacteria bacterium]|nr:hypothetical protein [Deltaproteobacteria bacterium]
MTAPRSLPLVAFALALALGVLVIQIRVVAGGKTWDDVRYHTEIAPARLAAAEQVQSGALPAWWDGSGLGVPLAAAPEHGAMYPPLWIAASPRALDLVMILHLAWAALGVALWARRSKVRASDQSALVAGVLVAASGILASAALRGALPALAHLPWLGVAIAALEAARNEEMTIAVGALAGERRVAWTRLAMVLMFAASTELAPRIAGRAVPFDALQMGLGFGYVAFALLTLYKVSTTAADPRRSAIRPALITLLDFTVVGALAVNGTRLDETYHPEMLAAVCAVLITFSVSRSRWWHPVLSLACALVTMFVVTAHAGALDATATTFVTGGFIALGLLVMMSSRATRAMFRDLRRRDAL